ncbi:MAG: AmmeMemoRadiSam system radical SAM enzyme [Saccharofermentanales bacterium]|jgi:pyruvate formate lyase activating enzyme
MTKQPRPAQYWLSQPNDEVVCRLCPHHCRIRPGKTGICRARQNLAGRLFAVNYGQVTSMALDPIEKKPLAFFRPGSQILSIGSFGCNLRCDFCQNWSISQQEAPTRTIMPDEVVAMAEQTVNRGNIGLAYTYNEPLIGFEYVLDCSRLIRQVGLSNILVTNGFIETGPFAELLPWIDALNIDLKSWDPSYYRSICGGDLSTVRSSIKQAAAVAHVEITTLLLPGLNDRDDDIRSLAGWLASINPKIPLHLTRYHPDYKRTDPPPISKERLMSLADLARKYLDRVLLGNILW